MGVRTARALAAALAFLTSSLVAPDGRADDAPQLPRPQLSAACVVPEADIALPGALRHTAEVLKRGGELRVLAIGSSSTAGFGASSPAMSYPAQVAQILERTFKGLDVVMVNRGVSGEAAATTVQRLRTQVALVNPRIVLWQVGTNDALARVPVDEFADTVGETVRWLKEHDIDLVLVGLQFTPRMARDAYYASIRTTLGRIARQEGILLVRRFEAMEYLLRNRPETFLAADGVHLNDLGYRCMAEHVARSVVAGAFDWSAAPSR